MKSNEPIPIPATQRLRMFRANVLPWMVFIAAIWGVAVLWKDRLGTVNMVGQAETVLANVSSHKAGIVSGLRVGRFQRVKAGETLASVIVADPQLVESSLAVVRSELDLLRAELSGPDVVQQRYAVDYAQLRIDWMRQRAELAAAKANLQFAESELRRTEELFKDKIASQSQLDENRATHGALAKQVDELGRLVTEGERAFASLQQASPAADAGSEKVRASIAAQEARLRMAEAELSPIILKSPIDGTVTSVNFRSGESITAGRPVVIIAADSSTRITGYLRQPIGFDPKPGDVVQVRFRNGRREAMKSQILDVGSQLEPLPLSLQSPLKLAGADLALPVNIAIPAGVSLRPGELVDISVMPAPSPASQP
jgi:multidrug resistance efflux pump